MVAFIKSDELFRIAIEMERSGMVFYEEIARQSNNDQTKAIFSYLAESEKRHMRKFKRLLKGKVLSPLQSYRNEYKNYLKALLNDRIFPSSSIARSRAAKSSPSASLSTGIKAEKDSILFYTEMLDLVSPQDKPVVYAILNEEKNIFAASMSTRAQAAYNYST